MKNWANRYCPHGSVTRFSVTRLLVGNSPLLAVIYFSPTFTHSPRNAVLYQDKILVRQLGLQPYEQSPRLCMNSPIPAMKVPLMNLAGRALSGIYPRAGRKSGALLMPGDIPVIQSDRGGQVTYTGRGNR